MTLKTFDLKFNANRWEELETKPEKTLQIFITNKCNLRCKGCFYAHNLDKGGEISCNQYSNIIKQYGKSVNKVILLGGEPTMHSCFPTLLLINKHNRLKTTVYTNGYNLNWFDEELLRHYQIKLRIGVLGVNRWEKKLNKIKTKLPVTIVFMLRRNNVDGLWRAIRYAEENFNCEDFYISSIRDIAETRSFWKDTEDTLSNEEYFNVVQNLITWYEGKIKRFHIARRGVIETEKSTHYKTCRFLNIFPDGKMTKCPFDISLQIYDGDDFSERPCNKNHECILQKVVLQLNT